MIQPERIRPQPAQALPRRDGYAQGLGQDPPRQQERPLHPAERRLFAADLQVVLDAGVVPPEVVARITTGACLSVEGELVASPGKGQSVELKAQAVTVHGAADPENYPLQKKKHTLETLREIGHLRVALQHVRRGLPRAQCAGRGDPQVLPGARLPLRPHAGHLGVGCRRRGLDVPGDHARARQSRADFDAGFLRPAHLPHGQRPVGSRDLRARLRQRLHLRPDLPRREFEHAAPPRRVLHDRAGDGLLRSEGQPGSRRGVSEEPGGAGADAPAAPDLEFLSKWYDPELLKTLER